ncbi:hypothetical protein [Amphiplicatus metriothermophilus]|uniref:Alginate export n=1 Tax=Amphiplicatus metriothermophilus TaxID=1519374 RepID=A0A239PKX0_9PROT|nr:hypothetical protein [Amphiplicatus metriothermophilus]MBB5517388.1 hypothetical protein [Amphiplicatus metriothermophilus]SNT68277.1 hypothetical protein SAMN06297382_0778 [Amphiplicatus metriothermophilus]
MAARRGARLFGCIFLIAALLAGAACPARASPWGRAAGEFFFSTRADYFRADAPAVEPDALGPVFFERVESHAYGELGLGRRLTIGGKVVYGSSTFFDGHSVFAADGVSEIEGFLQRELRRGERGVLALRLAGAAPSRFETGARPGLASDGVDVEARLLYGRNLALRPVKIFAAAEAAYRRRFGAAADQLRADFLLGVEPMSRLLFLAESFAVKGIGAAEPGGADFDVVRLQASAAWRATRRWTVQAGASSEIAGRNVLTGEAYFISLWSWF